MTTTTIIRIVADTSHEGGYEETWEIEVPGRIDPDDIIVTVADTCALGQPKVTQNYEVEHP